VMHTWSGAIAKLFDFEMYLVKVRKPLGTCC
jgi:hypothetical protein